jgi:hypothetical protein
MTEEEFQAEKRKLELDILRSKAAPKPLKANGWGTASVVFGAIGFVLISIVCSIIGFATFDKDIHKDNYRASLGLVLSFCWLFIACLVFAANQS